MTHTPQVIYENSDIVAINKPAGLTVHPDGRTPKESIPAPEQKLGTGQVASLGVGLETLVDWIQKTYPEMEDVGEPLVLTDDREILRPGIVHRLDKETSGVLILAKNQKTYLYLKSQFQKRDVEKVYNAFLYGEAKESNGVIDKTIGKSRSDFRLRSTDNNAQGVKRSAITNYKVLERTKAFTYVEARPKTGRTHQLRVHFKSIQHPIVCDKLYAPKRSCELGFTRLALHARSLSVILLSGEKVILEAPLPRDFLHALQKLKIQIARIE